MVHLIFGIVIVILTLWFLKSFYSLAIKFGKPAFKVFAILFVLFILLKVMIRI